MQFRSLTFAMTALCGFAVSDIANADSNWPGWRGPDGTGVSAEKGLPVEWTADSVTWKAPLKGRGHSTPVIWGERVFLTTALQNGRRRVVFCINRNDGQILWEKTAWTGEPEPTHRMNGWAAATCTTDGQHVYAFFGHGGGLVCYTVDGSLVWQKDLGEFVCRWGTAASPMLYGDLVIQNCDAEQNAYIAALDKISGETVWRTKRDDQRGWSSPILVRVNGKDQIVVNGHTGAKGYDAKTGKELWFCKSFRGRGTPTVATSKGLFHVVNGQPGDMYTIRFGGRGDITNTHMAWHTPRKGGRDLPSPIVVDKYLMVMGMKGVLACYNPKTGNELYTGRVPGNYASTPISHSGLAFFINEDGVTNVVKPGKKLNVVATNSVGANEEEIFRASITPSDGQLFIRSDQTLYCVGKRNSAKKKK